MSRRQCFTRWASTHMATTPTRSAAPTSSPPADRSRRCMAEAISDRRTEARRVERFFPPRVRSQPLRLSVSFALAGYFVVVGIAGCSRSAQTASAAPNATDEQSLLKHYGGGPTAPEYPNVKASVFI